MTASGQVPDLLGKAQRAKFVASTLVQAQQALLQLRAQKTLNGASDDEAVSGMQPSVPGGEVPTYGERIKQLSAGIEHLWTDNADVHDEIMANAENIQAQGS
jgi:hypothetical protein